MNPRTLGFFLPSLLLFAPGCLHEPGVDFEPDEVAAEPARVSGEDSEVDVAEDESTETDAPHGDRTASAIPRGLPGRDLHFFPLGAGYGALGRIDLSGCSDEGLAPGYWHVRVTFGPSGQIVHASVESPVAPSREALACIAQELADRRVPHFDGAGVTLSKSVFIAAPPAPAGGTEDIEVQAAPSHPASVTSMRLQ